MLLIYQFQIIEDPGDLEGWDKIKDEDKEVVLKLIREFSRYSTYGVT